MREDFYENKGMREDVYEHKAGGSGGGGGSAGDGRALGGDFYVGEMNLGGTGLV